MNKNNNEIKLFFDGLAEDWDKTCVHDQSKLSAIVTISGIKPGDKVLDIACGTGIMFDELLKREPSEILGIDISEKMIEKAALKCNDSRITLICSDFFELPCEDIEYDVALIYSAYPHFEDKERFARHIFNMLKDGGRFVIAHSQGKDEINGCHASSAFGVSTILKPASEEARDLSRYFDIDTIVDTPDLYIISGTKKS